MANCTIPHVTNWHGLLTIKFDRMKNKITGYKLTQNKKSDLQFLSEWIDLKTNKSDETATMIIEKITEMLKENIMMNTVSVNVHPISQSI